MFKRILFVYLFLSVAIGIHAQDVLPVALYAHQNQSVYNKGEKVYSKIYIKTIEGLHMQPVNVYVDWYTAEGKLLEHQQYLTNFGGVDASFIIPDDYSFNYLRMRMYTLSSLQQSLQNKYANQVVFVHQPNLSNPKSLSGSLPINTAGLQADESIKIIPVTTSFDSKGRNEWIIENKTKEFINLSVSVVEEESFESPKYTILSHFGKNLKEQSKVSVAYRDAFIQVSGILSLGTILPKDVTMSYSLLKRGQLPFAENVMLNDNGSFLIKQLVFFDSLQMGVQIDYRGKRKQKIPLSFKQLGLFNTAPLYAFNFSDTLPGIQFKKQSVLSSQFEKTNPNDVVVYTNVKSELEVLDRKYTTGLFRGGDAVNFNMMTPNVQSFPTLFHYLRGKVPGLQISFDNEGITVPLEGKNSGNGPSGRPRFSWRSELDLTNFFLNQVPTSLDVLMTINIAEIAYVKVFKPPFLGAALGSPNGAIAIYTKEGDENNYNPRDSKLSTFFLKGYTNYTSYQQPDYSSDKKRSVLDFRKTLNWISTIHLNHDKLLEGFVYYNNDRSKKHRIIIEGVKQNGELIRKEWIVE